MDAIADHGSRVKADLAALFRRVAFSIAIHNTDDHLRNHGLLRARGGWELSPVFDVNPQPDLGILRKTSVAGAVEVDEESGALLEFADECRLPEATAAEIIAEVCAAVERWRGVAARNGIGAKQRDLFADMFDHQLRQLRGAAR